MNRTSWTTEELQTLLSAVSHDLRTPLSVIAGRASVLRELVRADHRRDLDTIVEEAHNLSYTFENLLALIGAGRETASREWVPLEEVVGAVLVRLASVFDGRPLRADVPNELLAHLHPARGELLIANLLRRAAAHAAPDTPIEIAARRGDRVVSIEVVVRGPKVGVEQTHPHADDRATRADSLGLAACHAIVSSYGGSMKIGERAGEGMVLHACIPDGEPVPDLGPAQETE
ncbi:MAG TPA: histidine kinase dimerization/phospho-acceptor domain-containing protein [Kofleriaceae bacterium]|nr:histidine kinase dimerization/phospho-acceptor domain-containing protein [Kofleriaceae bacterium]